MAILAPFRGLIYNPERITDLSRVITPPYDVISPQQQEALYARHPHNMIQLDLGKNLPGDSPTYNRYTRAARLLKSWQKEKVLVREPKPAIYLYRIHYSFPGQGRRQRTGFIALLGLEPFDSGMVRPHEKTFSGNQGRSLSLARPLPGPVLSDFFLLLGPGKSGGGAALFPGPS